MGVKYLGREAGNTLTCIAATSSKAMYVNAKPPKTAKGRHSVRALLYPCLLTETSPSTTKAEAAISQFLTTASPIA